MRNNYEVNHYEVLGVSRLASKAEIRRAYLDLARRYHPDFNGQRSGSGNNRPGKSRGGTSEPSGRTADSTAERIREVNAAWDILGDSRRRSEYDEYLSLITGSGRSESGSSESWTGGHSGGFRTSADGSTRASRINRPEDSFTPYDTGPDPTESWRYASDKVNDATVPPKLLLAAPPLSFVGGSALIVINLVVGRDELLAAGVILLFASALLFIGAPLVAMAKSQNEEARARKRR